MPTNDIVNVPLNIVDLFAYFSQLLLKKKNSARNYMLLPSEYYLVENPIFDITGAGA